MGLQKLREGKRSGYEALNILNVNIDKYEQRQCNQLAGTFPIQCGSVGRIFPFTSLHTTGSLCVPVNEEKQKLLLVQKFCFFCMFFKNKQKKKTKTSLHSFDGHIGYLGFLFLCEIIFNVEGLPDLLRGFAFDHVGHCLTGDI